MRIPAGSDLFLHRPRLVELLNRAVGRQVTLVTGPAGTGKTLAVADWCRQGTAGSPIVWLSLAREDCHPPRLWKSLLDALLTGLGPAAFRDLELPDAPDVEAAALGPDGLASGMKPGSLYIDMSTIDPGTTQRIGAALAGKGVAMIDSPVGKTVEHRGLHVEVGEIGI